jgi:hypothetical protein
MESDFKFKKGEGGYGTLTRLTYNADGFGETVMLAAFRLSKVHRSTMRFFPQFYIRQTSRRASPQIRAIANSTEITGINWKRGFAFYTMTYVLAETNEASREKSHCQFMHDAVRTALHLDRIGVECDLCHG